MILFRFFPESVVVSSVILTAISSLIIWLCLRKFLIFKNSFLLWITIFIPGFAIWTCIPSKEATFITFSLIYICFEAKTIINKPLNKWNRNNRFFIRCIYLVICISLRGFATVPYLILGITVSLFPFISPFLIKVKNNSIIFIILIICSLIISVFLVLLINNSIPDLITSKIAYLNGSFLGDEFNLSRNFLFDLNPFSIKNIFLYPYLSLFPTINEILSNPKLILLSIDSIFYIIIYFFVWNRIINLKGLNHLKIKFLQYTLVLLTVSYIMIYGTIGAYNLGSSLRFRQNFVNIGHIFPLLIFYNYKRNNYSKENFKI